MTSEMYKKGKFSGEMNHPSKDYRTLEMSPTALGENTKRLTHDLR